MKILLIFTFPLLLLSCQSPQVKKQMVKNDTKVEDEDFFFKDEAISGKEKINPQAKNNFAKAKLTDEVTIGYAAWYGKELQDRPTASGEMFDMKKFTAAHRDFEMNSIVLVRNLENGKKQLVRINDRGPYVDGRVIDVSYAAAKELGFAEAGTAKVSVELIQKGKNDFLKKAQIENVVEEPIDEELADLEDEEELIEDKTPISSFSFIDGAKPVGFTVQVGAFHKRKNAEKYRSDVEDKYSKRGFIATKGKWHFVWVGDFKAQTKAKKFYKNLRKDGVDVVYRGKAF